MMLNFLSLGKDRKKLIIMIGFFVCDSWTTMCHTDAWIFKEQF